MGVLAIPRAVLFLSSIPLEAVEFRAIRPEDFLFVLFGDALEVLGDFFLRVGPESRAVGKVRRPEDVLDADLTAMVDAEGVIDERGTELAAKIFARLELQLGRKRRAAKTCSGSIEPFVDAKQEEWQPTAVQFRRDNLEPG